MSENEDVLTEGGEKIRAGIAEAVTEGLAEFEGKDLAVFEWTTRKDEKGGPITFTFGGETKGGRRHFDLLVGSKTRRFAWSVRHDSDDCICLDIRIMGPGKGGSDWTLVKSGNYVVATRESAEGEPAQYKADEDLRKPQGSQVLEQFARTWFEKDRSEGRGSVLKPGIERDDFPPNLNLIEQYWPTYDDGKWASQPPSPHCPEDGEREEWHGNWAAFLLALTIWRFTLYLHNGGDEKGLLFIFAD